MKKKWICTVCGYVHEGNEAPEKCPQCRQPKDKFKEYYGNSIDPRLLHCNNRMIDLSYTNDNIIYISSKYKRGVKCGQAYNINNLFYEMVEKKFRSAIIFDCVQGKRLTKELIQKKCNGKPTLYVIEYLREEYGVISFITRNNMAISILKKLQYFNKNF